MPRLKRRKNRSPIEAVKDIYLEQWTADPRLAGSILLCNSCSVEAFIESLRDDIHDNDGLWGKNSLRILFAEWQEFGWKNRTRNFWAIRSEGAGIANEWSFEVLYAITVRTDSSETDSPASFEVTINRLHAFESIPPFWLSGETLPRPRH